jgi:transcriptional regulator with XRE-family HTH domain
VPPTSSHQGATRRVTRAVGWPWQVWNLVYFYLDKKRVKQQELAENIGMSVVAIAYIETGKCWAKPGTLNKIANSLNVSVAGLFKGI